jgi:hypothetical protein
MNLRNILKVVMKMPVAFLQSARRAMILGMLLLGVLSLLRQWVQW